MRFSRRTSVLAVAILVLAFVAQSCSPYEVFVFSSAFVLQQRFAKNQQTQLEVEYFFFGHFALICGIMSVIMEPHVDVTARQKLPRFLTLGMTVFPPGAPPETFTHRMKLDKKNGVYSDGFNTPNGNLLSRSQDEECPDYDFDPGTFMGFWLMPERGSLPEDLVMGFWLAVRPPVDLEECEEEEIEAASGQTVRNVQWFKGARPGNSTVKVNASGDGILVHCRDIADGGEQGTVKMLLQPSGAEFVAINCDD